MSETPISRPRGRPPGSRPARATPTSPLAELPAYLIERNYKALGCDAWNTKKVMLLCAKLGDSPSVLGARMRLRPAEFARRMETDVWTRQDGLILTILNREIEHLRGGNAPSGHLIPTDRVTQSP